MIQKAYIPFDNRKLVKNKKKINRIAFVLFPSYIISVLYRLVIVTSSHHFVISQTTKHTCNDGVSMESINLYRFYVCFNKCFSAIIDFNFNFDCNN